MDLKILIYKRTHLGDPDKYGCFGIRDWMAQVRGYDFEAVIGVGGTGSEPKYCKIDGKINWVGISPVKINYKSYW